MNQKNGISNNYNKKIIWLANMLFIFDLIVFVIISSLRSIIILPFKIDTLILYGLLSVLILVNLKHIYRNIDYKIIGIIFFSLFSFLIDILFNINYVQYINDLFVLFLIRFLPWLLIGYSLTDFSYYLKSLYKVSITVLILFSTILFLKIDIFVGGSYTQDYGYVLLLPGIVFLNRIFHKFQLIDFALFVMSLLFVISMGARGPLLVIFIYLFIQIYLKFRDFSIKWIPILVSFGTLIICFTFFGNEIIDILLSLFSRFNLSLRNLEIISNGDFFTDTSRFKLFSESISMINNYPIFGYGIGMERPLLSFRLTGSFNNYIGWYPHNIFLEIILHFGILIGSIVLLLLFKNMIASIKTANCEAKEILIILLCIGFIPLLFSGSYISYSPFALYLGFSMNKRLLRKVYEN